MILSLKIWKWELAASLFFNGGYKKKLFAEASVGISLTTVLEHNVGPDKLLCRSVYLSISAPFPELWSYTCTNYGYSWCRSISLLCFSIILDRTVGYND
jgi:hypothetical protein